MRSQIITMLREVGNHYKERGVADCQLYIDIGIVHALYLVNGNGRGIHVIASPCKIHIGQVDVKASEVSRDFLERLRDEDPSLDKEGKMLTNFPFKYNIDCRSEVLEGLLEQDVPELKSH